MEDSEEVLKLEIPNIYVFSIFDNKLYLDPCDEELIITHSNLYISEYNKKLLNIESIGDSVDPILYSQISKILESIIQSINNYLNYKMLIICILQTCISYLYLNYCYRN